VIVAGVVKQWTTQSRVMRARLQASEAGMLKKNALIKHIE